jgi:hypothetical protein
MTNAVRPRRQASPPDSSGSSRLPPESRAKLKEMLCDLARERARRHHAAERAATDGGESDGAPREAGTANP